MAVLTPARRADQGVADPATRAHGGRRRDHPDVEAERAMVMATFIDLIEEMCAS
jgi:hypothetical protein